MNISDTFLTMAEVSEPALFPFPIGLYAIFCVIALAFFVFRFMKEKAPYQLIMAIAIPFSLLIGLSNGKTLFYLVGIVELLLLISAFVVSIVCKKKTPETMPEKSEETEEKISEEE